MLRVGSMEMHCKLGRVRAMRLLLDRGANVNMQGGEYNNALQAAASRGEHEAIQLLLDEGAVVNAQGGPYGNALQAAAYSGIPEAIQLLLDKGADIHAQGGQYGNALQAAAGKIDAMQLLLHHGADVNAQGGEYGNALQAAAYWGRVRCVRLLLNKGANVNAQGGVYGTALQAAVATPFPDDRSNDALHIAEILLDHGADPTTYVPGSKYGDALSAAKRLWRHHDFYLARFIKLLESKGWKRSGLDIHENRP